MLSYSYIRSAQTVGFVCLLPAAGWGDITETWGEMYSFCLATSFETQGQLLICFAFTAELQRSVIQFGCLNPFRLPIVLQSLFSFSIYSLLFEDGDQTKWWGATGEDIKLVLGSHAIYIHDVSGPTSCSVCVIFRRAIIRRRSVGWNCANTVGEGDQNAWKSSGLVMTGSQDPWWLWLMDWENWRRALSSERAACMARRAV